MTRHGKGQRLGHGQGAFLPIAISLTISLGSIVVTAGRAHGDVLTLEAIEQLALHERAPLQADAAATRAAQAEVDNAERAYLPNLGLHAETGIAPGRELITVHDGDDLSRDYYVQGARKLGESNAFEPQVRSDLDLELKGNLYDFGRTRAAVAASRARSAAVAAERDVTAQAIVEAVRASYVRWLGSFELLALAAQSASDAGARRTRVQALITEGVRPTADLTPAQADEALGALELERARGNLRAAKLALEHAAGAVLPDNAEPDRNLLERHAALSTAATANPGTAPTNAPGTTESRSSAAGDPVARAIALQAAAARASAHAAERSDAPALSAGLSAGLHAQNLTPFPSYAVGLGLSVPLWDGGASDASADVARAHASELDLRQRARSQSERERRARAALDDENATALLRAASDLQSICDKRLHEAEQAYELGASGIEPIAQARNGLRHAQTEVVLARLAKLQAALALPAGP